MPHDVLEDLLWALPRPGLVPLTGTGRGPARNEFVGRSGRPCVEELVAVGSRGHCGVLTGPATAPPPAGEEHGDHATAPDVPAVLLVSAAHGARDDAGLWPPVARRLADCGVVTLRADADGAGDRVPLWQERIPDPGRVSGSRAVGHQLRWLSARQPGPVVLVAAGGGIPAARRAASVADGAVVGRLVLVGASGAAAPGLRPHGATGSTLGAVRGLLSRLGKPSRAGREHRVAAGGVPVPTRSARERTARELAALLGTRS